MNLPVGLSHALDLVLLLDGVRVGRALGSVDELLSEALSDGLDVAEGCFASTRVHHSINDDLDRVLAGKQVDDVAGVLHDAHSHDLLTVVTAVHHERASDALYDWALSLLETLLRPTASGVGQEGCVGRLGCNVIRERDLIDSNFLEGVFVEE